MRVLSKNEIEQLDAAGLYRYAEFTRSPEYLRQLAAMPSDGLREIIRQSGQDAYATPEMARRMDEIKRLDAEQSRDMDLLAQLDKMIEWSENDPDTRYSDARVMGLAEQVYDRLGPRQENFRQRMAEIDRQYFGDTPPQSQFDQPQPSADWYNQTASCLATAAPECTPAQAQAAMQRFEQAFANHSHKEQILAPIRARLLGGQRQDVRTSSTS